MMSYTMNGRHYSLKFNKYRALRALGLKGDAMKNKC